MTAPVIMILGTASSVGKSTLVAALCRIAARRGVRVAPFKAQNMSNNAAVTADGGEIGRSTAVQAAAAGIEPTVVMNPILIKPEGERRSQIIVEGRVWQTLDALDYWQRKQMLWDVVTRNLDTLREQYDLVIGEGAGSPVELNLKPNDIVNMRVAIYTQARTLLVGDIDAGGIFAALLGTLALLEPDERALVRGLIVNRFRGDPALFTDGVRILEERSNLPVLGVVPWINDLGIAQEDAVALERPGVRGQGSGVRDRRSVTHQRSSSVLCRPSPAVRPPPSVPRRPSFVGRRSSFVTIAILHFPQIANFDDFDPVASENGVTVRYITNPGEMTDADAVVLPGTKHTLASLRWLRQRGFDAALARYAGHVVGICGGYQVLGERISDPHGVEGAGGDEVGLDLLPVTTVFADTKRTAQIEAQARVPWANDVALQGYEIHMGRTTTTNSAAHPVATITRRGDTPCDHADGTISADGRVWGCYIHGLFANTAFRHAWLRTLGWRASPNDISIDPYDQLADVVEAHLDAELLASLVRVTR